MHFHDMSEELRKWGDQSRHEEVGEEFHLAFRRISRCVKKFGGMVLVSLSYGQVEGSIWFCDGGIILVAQAAVDSSGVRVNRVVVAE